MTAYICPLCGRIMAGNGARTSHLRRHRRERAEADLRSAEAFGEEVMDGMFASLRIELAHPADPLLSAKARAAASREDRRSDRLAELTDALEAEHVRRYGMRPCEE